MLRDCLYASCVSLLSIQHQLQAQLRAWPQLQACHVQHVTMPVAVHVAVHASYAWASLCHLCSNPALLCVVTLPYSAYVHTDGTGMILAHSDNTWPSLVCCLCLTNAAESVALAISVAVATTHLLTPGLNKCTTRGSCN